MNGAGWFKVDNFRLFFINEDSHVSGISSVNTDNGQPIVGQEYYTLDGQRIAQPHKGVVIVKNRLANGTVKVGKILVK